MSDENTHITGTGSRTTGTPTSTEIAVLRIGSGHTPQLRRLAALDSAEIPAGDLLGAEVDGELLAIISIPEGKVIADPFRSTSEAVQLLQLRRRQLRGRTAGRFHRGLGIARRGHTRGALPASPPGGGGRLLQL